MDHLAQSTPGEELVLFNQVPDGNDGQELPANPLFGELMGSTAVTALPFGTVPVGDIAALQTADRA